MALGCHRPANIYCCCHCQCFLSRSTFCTTSCLEQHSLLAHLFTRFYQVHASQDFHTELAEYLTHTGCYVSIASHCRRARNKAQVKVDTFSFLVAIVRLIIGCSAYIQICCPYLLISHLQGSCPLRLFNL